MPFNPKEGRNPNSGRMARERLKLEAYFGMLLRPPRSATNLKRKQLDYGTRRLWRSLAHGISCAHFSWPHTIESSMEAKTEVAIVASICASKDEKKSVGALGRKAHTGTVITHKKSFGANTQ